jgi:hypothetical protein
MVVRKSQENGTAIRKEIESNLFTKSRSVLSVKETIMADPKDDNRSRQLNDQDDQFWKDRGFQSRDEALKARKATEDDYPEIEHCHDDP